MPIAVVIDDDQPQRAVTVFNLRKAGFTVHEAADGETGLRRIREVHPDVVVCDVMMPRMNGYQVVAAIRADASIADTLVILLTAMAERGQMRLGMTSGADDYVCKPYKQHELIEAIEAAASRRHARRTAVLAALRDSDEHAVGGEPRLIFRGATLLLANVMEALPGGSSAHGASADQAGRVLQATRDTLFLFGASQVLSYGADVLAIFGSERDDHCVRAASRAAKAAFKLGATVERAMCMRPSDGRVPLTVALHTGDVSLVRLEDLLHGAGGYAPVPGAALQFVGALRDYAKGRGWAVSASAATLPAIAADVARTALRASISERQVAQLQPA